MLIETSAGEAIEPEESGAPEAEESEPAETKSTDPLDAIEDETARNLAKAERAKARREAKKEATTATEPKPEPEPVTTAYATKDDLKRMATIEAKKLVAPEVKATWDELVAIPLGGFDPLDAESIAENMRQRYVLHMQKQATAEDPTKAFTASSVIPTGGGPTGTTKPKDAPSLPGYKEPTPPTEWYK